MSGTGFVVVAPVPDASFILSDETRTVGTVSRLMSYVLALMPNPQSLIPNPQLNPLRFLQRQVPVVLRIKHQVVIHLRNSIQSL